MAARGSVEITAGSHARTATPTEEMICFHDWKADVVSNWAGLMSKRVRTRFEKFSFGSIRIDGITYEHDVVIDQGNIRKRNKKPSKKFRDTYGHTPLSVDEDIPWKCERLVVGTGTGALPVMDEVKREARRRKIKLDILPTAEAIRALQEAPEQTNAILHVTC